MGVRDSSQREGDGCRVYSDRRRLTWVTAVYRQADSLRNDVKVVINLEKVPVYAG
jgi:hypothetical protein